MNNNHFEQILKDNKDYISVIVNTYQKNKIKYYGKCQLSKDEIEQNIRIAIWRALPKYKPDGGMSIKSFIWQSAHWELNREYKQINKPIPNKEDVGVNIQMADIEDCINSLPEKYSTVLKKYHIDGKTLSEIGKEIDRTAEAVRIRLKKAVKLFKERWGNL